jgi:hypothetical protein
MGIFVEVRQPILSDFLSLQRDHSDLIRIKRLPLKTVHISGAGGRPVDGNA